MPVQPFALMAPPHVNLAPAPYSTLRCRRNPPNAHRGPAGALRDDPFEMESVVSTVESSISMPHEAGAPTRVPTRVLVKVIPLKVPVTVFSVLNETPSSVAATPRRAPVMVLPMLSEAPTIQLSTTANIVGIPPVDELDVLVE
jgi:hypothetical protein